VAGTEDVEDLDRIRDPLWGEFEPRVPIKQGSTAGSELVLPFFSKAFLMLPFIVIINFESQLGIRTCSAGKQ
jgi:hypothetical protein